jgi:tRNA U34 5-methylaminomethyl-2-thiouridine-forming methyltransferase MnmC
MLELQPTADGSFTFFSTEFSQSFHSSTGAKEEEIGKFAIPTQLASRALTYPQVKIFDPCYGLGYNCAAALQAIWSANPHCPVEIMALEINPEVATAAIKQQLLADWPAPIPTLQEYQLFARDCLSFPELGPHYGRVALKSADDNHWLLVALEQVCAS